MSSSHKKDLTILSTSKGAGEAVTGDTIIIPPDCEELLLAVTTDDSVTGAVNAELEVSVDGVNWAPAKTKTLGIANIPAQIAHGTITYPALNAAAGTDVCSVSYSGGLLASNPTYVIELTGTDADKYRLNNVTQGTTPSDTLTAVVFGDSIVLETYKDDNSGGSYAFNYTTTGFQHDDVNIKVTESTNSLDASVDVDNIADTPVGIWRWVAASMAIASQVAMAGDAASGTDTCVAKPAGGPTSPVQASYSLTVSDTVADSGHSNYYQLRNTNSGSVGKTVTCTKAESDANQVVLEADELFNFADGATHAVTITNTESIKSQTATIAVSVTVDAIVTYENIKYFKTSNSVQYPFKSVSPFGGMGTNDMPNNTDAWSMSYWYTFEDVTDVSTFAFDNVYYQYTDNWNFLAGGQLMSVRQTVYGNQTSGTQWKSTYDVYFTGVVGGITFNPTYSHGTTHTHDEGDWVNVVVVKNATVADANCAASDFDFYVNGVKSTGVTVTTTTPVWKSHTPAAHWSTYSLGMFSTPSSVGPKSFDEVATWNRVLTQAEVTAINTSADGSKPAMVDINSDDVGGTGEDLSAASGGLVGFWRCGDGTANLDGTGTADSTTLIHDMSGQDEDLTGSLSGPTIETH